MQYNITIVANQIRFANTIQPIKCIVNLTIKGLPNAGTPAGLLSGEFTGGLDNTFGNSWYFKSISSIDDGVQNLTWRTKQQKIVAMFEQKLVNNKPSNVYPNKTMPYSIISEMRPPVDWWVSGGFSWADIFASQLGGLIGYGGEYYAMVGLNIEFYAEGDDVNVEP